MTTKPLPHRSIESVIAMVRKVGEERNRAAREIPFVQADKPTFFSVHAGLELCTQMKQLPTADPAKSIRVPFDLTHPDLLIAALNHASEVAERTGCTLAVNISDGTPALTADDPEALGWAVLML